MRVNCRASRRSKLASLDKSGGTQCRAGRTNLKEIVYTSFVKSKKNKSFHCNYALVVAEISKPFLQRYPFNNMTVAPL